MIRIGVLGFGEAGSIFAAALARAGAAVDSYDRLWDARDAAHLTELAADHPGIGFCRLPELIEAADVILSTVTTDAALDAARACLPCLKQGQLYCDLNSTAPAVKRELDELLEPSGATFVEGAILGLIGVTGANTQILLGGREAEALSARLNGLGLNTSTYSAEIGRASTFKMLRSVFSKGLEALIIEFLLAGHEAGLEDDLWREVTALMDDNGFDKVAHNWVCSHAVAHARRYHEMVQVEALLDEMRIDPVMTAATRRFFERSTELELAGDFADKPESMRDVIETLLRRTRRDGR
jgi:3-hydroxyisobutyrate dehydrogenase-like beta-hydroxyacid dehydrogenase